MGSSTTDDSLEALEESVRKCRAAVLASDLAIKDISLGDLGDALVRVHQITGTAEVLEEAIRTYEEALQLCPTGHDRRDACVINLGDGLLRFCDSEDADSPRLERCIALLREALELRPPGHSARDEALDVLGCALWLRFRHRGDMDMLKEVIGIGREILQLRPPEHVGYTDSLLFLAKSLRKSFELSGDSTQLDEAIQLQREVLLSCPPGHELRIFYLRGLGASLTFRFHVQGGLDTLDEAIDLHRAALSLCPPGDGSRAEGLDKLAYCLHQRFRQRDDLGTLQEAIELHREALHLRPVGDPSRQMTLTNLGFALRDLSDLQGNFDILHEAIQLQREALRLCPVGHPKRGFFLNNLARCLHHWLERTISGQEVFDEVVYLYREALSLHPPGHRDRSEALSGLASILRIRFLRQGGLETWTEAVDLGREALQLTPPGSPYRRIYLNNLAATLSTLTPEQYSVRAIDEAIQLQREALRLCPPGHLLHNELGAENLAQNLETRSRREGDLEALEEALNLVRGVLELRPPGHPRRSSALSLLGRCLLAEHTKVFDFTQAMTYFLQALTDDATAFDVRLDIAKQFLIAVEHAYPTAMSDLDVATQAERNLSILKLYNEAVHLLPRAANFGLDRQTRLTTVARSESVSCYAAARALLLGRANEAVEMLEEGRGVFWSQTLYLRAYGLEDVPVDDRQELQQIFHTLQNDNEIQKASSEDRDRVLEERRQLSLRADAVIARIRGYPGLERFLLPPAFSALMGSMPDGFVVILNASQLVHHALLIDRKAGLAKSFALKSPGDDFVYAKLHTRLPRDLGASLSTEDAEDEVDSRGIGIASKRSAKQGFEGALAKLWVIIVQPILEKLGLQVASGRSRPRIWWCATGEFSFLPVHAAGSYGTASAATRTSGYVVSSYVPTLSALTKARRGWQAIPCTELTGLAICETSSGDSYLANVLDEVRTVRDCWEAAQTRVLNIPSAHTSVTQMKNLLAGPPAHILHLASHGVQETEPLKSSFLLKDGNLSIEDIMEYDLPHAVLAFLSACRTAQGDANAPNQAVHLAASMLFCGFRSVIGTMWLMHDDDGPQVARRVYERLFEQGQLDLDDVPYALDDAVQMLRDVGVPPARWALFVHMGG